MGRLSKHRKLKDVSMRDRDAHKKDNTPAAEEKLPKRLREIMRFQKHMELKKQQKTQRSAPALDPTESTATSPPTTVPPQIPTSQNASSSTAEPAPQKKDNDFRTASLPTSLAKITDQEEGETVGHFIRRLKRTTKDAIKEEREANPRKKAAMRPARKAHLKKRAEKLKQKKLAKKQKTALSSANQEERQAQHQALWEQLQSKHKRAGAGAEPESTRESKSSKDFHQLRDPVLFGEVVDRPPRLNLKRERQGAATRQSLKELVSSRRSDSRQSDEAGKKAELAYRQMRQLQRIKAVKQSAAS